MDWEGQQFYYFRLLFSDICNQHCTYCHVFNKDKTSRYGQPGLMKEETAKAAIDAIEQLTTKSKQATIQIVFYGGEPLINWKSLKATLAYGRDRLSRNHQIEWVLNTNGSLLTPHIIETLKKENVDIHLSIDGPDEASNRFRKLKSGKSAFLRIRRCLDSLSQSGCRVQFNTCLTEANLNSLKELIDLAAMKNIQRICLSMIDLVSLNEGGNNLDIKMAARNIKEAYFYGKTKGVILGGPWRRAVLSPYNGSSAELIMPNLIIDQLGQVFIFEFSETPLGHVNFLSSIPERPEFKGLLKRWGEIRSGCNDCELGKSCKGYLKSTTRYHTGGLLGSEKQCGLVKNILEEMINPDNSQTDHNRKSPAAKIVLSKSLVSEIQGQQKFIRHRKNQRAIQASEDLIYLLESFKEPQDIKTIAMQFEIPDLKLNIARLMEMEFLVPEKADEELLRLNPDMTAKKKRSQETDHFIVFSVDELTQRALELAGMLEKAYAKLISKGLPEPSQKIIINICVDRKEFHSFWGPAYLPEWPKAFVAQGRILVVDPQKLLKTDLSSERYFRGMSHELVHVFLRQHYCRLPVWAEEGLCEYFSQPYDESLFKQIAGRKKIYGFREMELFINHSFLDLDTDMVPENICYRQSHSFIIFLSDLIGENILLKCVLATG